MPGVSWNRAQDHHILFQLCQKTKRGTSIGGPVVKNLPDSGGDTGLIPGPRGFHIPRDN